MYEELSGNTQKKIDKIPKEFKLAKITKGLKDYLRNNWTSLLYQRVISHFNFEAMSVDHQKKLSIKYKWLAKFEQK